MINETFLPIEDYPYYSISNYGNIYSLFSNKLKAFKYKSNGYLAVDLSRDGRHYIHHIHRLVAKAFIANPLGKPDVNHIDCNKRNNHVNNLEWVTKSENMRHAVATGLCSYTSRLTEEHIKYCLAKIYEGSSIKELSLELEYYSTAGLKKLIDAHAKNTGVYDEYMALLKSRLSKSCRVPVIQMTMLGDYIMLWESLSEASRKLSIPTGNISSVISGRYKHAAGFTWRYATEEEILKGHQCLTQ